MQRKLRIDPRTNTIARDYDDGFLELVQLLCEAAALEHSLMIAYLYGAFSLPAAERGVIDAQSYGRRGLPPRSLLDVALGEMQHLSQVNWFLAELGAAPHFRTHDFPCVTNIYPFPILLQPLTKEVVAKYLYIEADDVKLTPPDQSPRPIGAEPSDFVQDVINALAGTPPPNHVGSIYRRIIDQIYEVEKAPPDFLGDNFNWARWKDEMNDICFDGEMGHYQLFRSIFVGQTFGQPMPHRTAYPYAADDDSSDGQPVTPLSDRQQRLAWLSNLHYWIILCLLDLSYRTNTRHLSYKTMNNMTMALWILGQDLADRFNTAGGETAVGLPFDAMGQSYTLGRSDRFTVQVLKRLIGEAQIKAIGLKREQLLPPNYDLRIFESTLANIDQLAAMFVQPDGLEYRLG